MIQSYFLCMLLPSPPPTIYCMLCVPMVQTHLPWKKSKKKKEYHSCRMLVHRVADGVCAQYTAALDLLKSVVNLCVEGFDLSVAVGLRLRSMKPGLCGDQL